MGVGEGEVGLGQKYHVNDHRSKLERKYSNMNLEQDHCDVARSAAIL